MTHSHLPAKRSEQHPPRQEFTALNWQCWNMLLSWMLCLLFPHLQWRTQEPNYHCDPNMRKTYFKHNFFLTWALGNWLQLSPNPQGCHFNLQLLLYLSPPPIPYLNQIKQTARARKKQRHQFAQKHLTASTKYSRHLSLCPTSDPAQ